MDNVALPVHGAELEQGLFGSLPTLWLQQHIFGLWPGPLEWATVVVHSSWFFVPALAAVFVTWKRIDRVGSFFRWWIALQFIVLPLFALFPLRPPWMANEEVTRIIALRFGGQIDDSNPLAAMPSLHVAFPLLVSLWFLRERWKAPGVMMLGYSALIAFEVVFSGEHYVVDVIGAAVVAVGIVLLARLDYRGAFRHLCGAIARVGTRDRQRDARPSPGTLVPVRHGQRGQTLIEFVLIAPLIFVFLFVIVDFGIALDRRITLQHAVADGARRGAVDPDVARTIEYTEDESQGLLDNTANPGAVVVCFMNDDEDETWGEVGDSIVVKADFDYEFTMGFGELFNAFGVPIPDSIKMNPSATERLETTVAVAPADQCP